MNSKLVDIYAIIAMSFLIFMALVPDASAQAVAILLIGIIAIIIVIFIIWIMVVVWVYRDAESRGQNGVLWLLVVLVGGIIGLILYFVLRSGWPEHPPPVGPYGHYPPPLRARYCDNCRRQIPIDSAFCPYCGAQKDLNPSKHKTPPETRQSAERIPIEEDNHKPPHM
jgi:hypothetical protein